MALLLPSVRSALTAAYCPRTHIGEAFENVCESIWKAHVSYTLASPILYRVSSSFECQTRNWRLPDFSQPLEPPAVLS